MTEQITFCKLTDDTWGVRIYDRSPRGTRHLHRAGDTVQVEKRDGKRTTVTLGAMEFQGNGDKGYYRIRGDERPGRRDEALARARRPRTQYQRAVDQGAIRPAVKRHLTPTPGAPRLASGLFESYDIVAPVAGVPHKSYTRTGLVKFNHANGEYGYEFYVIGGPNVWVGAAAPADAAKAVLTHEGRILAEQVEYERANGWSTD